MADGIPHGPPLGPGSPRPSDPADVSVELGGEPTGAAGGGGGAGGDANGATLAGAAAAAAASGPASSSEPVKRPEQAHAPPPTPRGAAATPSSLLDADAPVKAGDDSDSPAARSSAEVPTEKRDLRDAPTEPEDPSVWGAAAAVWSDPWKHHNEPVNHEPTFSTIVRLMLFNVFAAPFLFAFASAEHAADNKPGCCCCAAPLCCSTNTRKLYSPDPFRIMFISWAVIAVTVLAFVVPFWATAVDVVAILTTYVALCFTGAVEEASNREAARQQQQRTGEETRRQSKTVRERAMDARVEGGIKYFRLLGLYISGSDLVTSCLALQRESLHFLKELFVIQLKFRMADKVYANVNAVRFAMRLIEISRQRAKTRIRHQIWRGAGIFVAVLILAGRFFVHLDVGDAAMFEGFVEGVSDAGSIILAIIYLVLLLALLCWTLPLLFQTFGRVVDGSVQERYIFLVLCRAVKGECEPYDDEIIGGPDVSRMAWSNFGLRATVHLYLWTMLMLEKPRQVMNRTLGFVMGVHALGSAVVLFRTVSTDGTVAFTFHWAVILLTFAVYTVVVCDVINEGHRANSAHRSLLRQTRKLQVEMAVLDSVRDRGREIRNRAVRRFERDIRQHELARGNGEAKAGSLLEATYASGEHQPAPSPRRSAVSEEDTPPEPDTITLSQAGADTALPRIPPKIPEEDELSGGDEDHAGRGESSSQDGKRDSSPSDRELSQQEIYPGEVQLPTPAGSGLARKSWDANPKPHAVESFAEVIETSGAAASFFGVELRRGLLLSYVSASVSLLTLCFARLDITGFFQPQV